MATLFWERVDSNSKDLRLVNPADFNKGEYRRVLKKFAGVAGSKLSGRLLSCLEALGEDPENTVFTFRSDRLGYDGLNRWSVTEGSRYTDDEVFAACKVWKFLFGRDNPPTLVKSVGRGSLEVNEGAWNIWYETISKASD